MKETKVPVYVITEANRYVKFFINGSSFKRNFCLSSHLHMKVET